MLWRREEEVEYSDGDYLIRKAKPSDAKGIIDCMQGVMDEKIYLVSEYYLLTEKAQQDHIRSPDDLTLVCEHGKRIVGVLTLQRGIFKKNRHVGTLGIAITKGYRHMGLGTRMIKSAIKWAREQGIEKVCLEVFSSNLNAIEAYKKIGFTVEGSKSRQFIIEGEYVDDVFMSYFIDDEEEIT
ncbi:MAG: GNAT family N-acetyltransferase [Candidatus Thermoplasmatota archaeon]|nr:GNAT family N-acetyltransferase [Candidatus Thermoplasmatota archaeon]MCL5665511.1 GNAT family N-acetyltransferase [Candidatus Thermoplasmatota archaeon]